LRFLLTVRATPGAGGAANERWFWITPSPKRGRWSVGPIAGVAQGVLLPRSSVLPLRLRS